MSNFPVIASILSEKYLGAFVKVHYNLKEEFECVAFPKNRTV